MSSNESSDLKPFHLALYLLGGAFTGVGALNLYWSFGREDGPLNVDFTTVGFSGLDNIALLPSGQFAIPLVFVGVMMLVFANMTAWKETGGY